MKKIFSLAIVLSFISISCSTSKVIAPPPAPEIDTTPCQFKATLLDYTSNVNCQFLFQLEDGTKLLPSSMPTVSIPFMDKKTVLIGYKAYDPENTKTNSKCSVEDKIVEITCIQEYIDPNDNSPKKHKDCQSVKNIYKNSWMPEIVIKIKPQKVYEYEYTSGYLYIFQKGETRYLYDCLGNTMCNTNDNGDCNSLISTIGKGKLIQVLKN